MKAALRVLIAIGTIVGIIATIYGLSFVPQLRWPKLYEGGPPIFWGRVMIGIVTAAVVFIAVLFTGLVWAGIGALSNADWVNRFADRLTALPKRRIKAVPLDELSRMKHTANRSEKFL